MKLAELRKGETAEITRVPGDEAGIRRLREMGVLPGTKIEMVRVAPLGDPVEFKVRGCRLSLRRAQVAGIHVRKAGT